MADADVLDVLDTGGDPTAYWSTANTGEAVPGVLTPLNWSLWERGGEGGLRMALVNVGALERRHAELPPPGSERIMGLFHGRLAASVDFMGRMGDRLPATSGEAVARQILGQLPDDFVSEPTLRRLAAIAVAMPRALTGSPRAVRALVRETAPWWSAEIARAPVLSFAAALDQFTAAERALMHTLGVHTTCVFAAIQPFYDGIQRMTAAVGEPQLAQRLLAGQGNHAEVAVVDDLWSVSRDRLSLDAFLARHGYHGPHEGEISSAVWREEPAPLRALVEQFRTRPDTDDPDGVLALRAAERREAERRLLAAMPRGRRSAVRFFLEAAGRTVPLRGVGKGAFLQCADVARAASRTLGRHLHEGGAIDAPDDVFLLTLDEIRAAGTGGRLQHVVAARHEQRARHLAVTLPTGWRGRPEVSAITRDDGPRAGLRVEGLGVSPGIAEARARVVLDAHAGEIAPDEILVAPYTDPSWAPLMFASAGLVVDIGGELSHAAVVARELGIPCVMGTGDGTRRLRDGDLCRIDGDAGTVDVIEPAG